MREMLDSGDRRQFFTGAKRDTDEGKQKFSDFSLDQWNGMMRDEQGAKFNPIAVESGEMEHGDFMYNPEFVVLEAIWDKATRLMSFSRNFFGKKSSGHIFFNRDGDPIRCYAEPLMLNRLQGIMVAGANKYDEDNWKKGIPLSVTFNSTMRHLLMWFFGDRREDHLAAVIFNVQCLMYTERDIYLGDLPEDLADAGLLKHCKNRKDVLS